MPTSGILNSLIDKSEKQIAFINLILICFLMLFDLMK